MKNEKEKIIDEKITEIMGSTYSNHEDFKKHITEILSRVFKESYDLGYRIGFYEAKEMFDVKID